MFRGLRKDVICLTFVFLYGVGADSWGVVRYLEKDTSHERIFYSETSVMCPLGSMLRMDDCYTPGYATQMDTSKGAKKYCIHRFAPEGNR